MKLFSAYAAAELLERDRQTLTRALRSTPADGQERGQPRWKMATATFLGVFPTAAILNLTLGRAIQPWPFIFGSAVFNACMVALLTWLVMPLVTRALHGWLHSNERKT